MRARMKNAVIYIHGKGGNTDEAYYYKKFFSDEYDVIGFDYKSPDSASVHAGASLGPSVDA